MEGQFQSYSRYKVLTAVYKKEDNVGVISSQISGRDWGRTLYWLLETNEKLRDDIIKDSTAWGNYDSISLTGSNEKYKMNNIYDFSGNVWEYTTENISGSGVSRGNGAVYVNKKMVSVRNSSLDNYLLAGAVSSRMVLYLK